MRKIMRLFHKPTKCNDKFDNGYIRTLCGNGWNEWINYTCNSCGDTVDGKNLRSMPNYCPNCGKKWSAGK